MRMPENLPPENSVWGKNSTAFFSHLIPLMYTCNYADGMYLCGDYNARVGRGSDIINDVDDLPDRKIIDNVKNSHGDVLLEFLKDTQTCILNGRLTADFDNYTSLLTRDKSVVDYIITPHDCFTFCKSVKVDLVNDIIDSYKLTELIGERCRPPDHSVLTLTFTSCTLSGTHTNDRNVVSSVVYDDSDCDSYQDEPQKNDNCLKMYLHSFLIMNYGDRRSCIW